MEDTILNALMSDILFKIFQFLNEWLKFIFMKVTFVIDYALHTYRGLPRKIAPPPPAKHRAILLATL